ncbi:MAG: HEAT repeat domain-containing protein, partial [Gemmataceae bacterium]|nr:HEAT repeat domain-containing protein [Gemmataceae bacterium]
MTGTRWLLLTLAGLAVAGPAGAGMFERKPKTAAQVKRLADGLRADGDEKRRRAAVAELREADPRVLPDVIPALVGVLQRDPSAAVRADAAEAIGSFKTAFPVAGAALEAAAEADPSAAVRDAAQQALWEYHLNGYRSLKGADGIAGQTAEPPLAKRPPKPTAPEAVTPAPGSAVVPLKPDPAAAPTEA